MNNFNILMVLSVVALLLPGMAIYYVWMLDKSLRRGASVHTVGSILRPAPYPIYMRQPLYSSGSFSGGYGGGAGSSCADSGGAGGGSCS